MPSFVFKLTLLLFICSQAAWGIDSSDSNITVAAPESKLQLLSARRNKISNALKSTLPIIKLDSMSAEQKQAYQLILKSSKFTKSLRSKAGQPFLNEIFGIYPARPGDLKDTTTEDLKNVFKVELYNFALNLATVGLVDLKNKKIIEVFEYVDSQPDIPLSLKNLAIEIAGNAPEVIAALGQKPLAKDALMASTKTALNRTRCERSRHLCVAPTFVQKDKALWAIVDLTELNIAGIRWTNVGETGPAIVTERKLQDDHITSNFCEQENVVERDGWKINYHITSSDGLEIEEVAFKGRPILKSAKLVDWHVRYSNTEGFGYSDAVGCPVFSQAAVVANQPPKVTEIKGPAEKGFALELTYFNQDWPKPCNYNYKQRYEFFSDGKFRVSAASIGRGCGNDGTYTPVFRIAFSNPKKISSYHEGTWQQWDKEQWTLQSSSTEYYKDKYQFKIESKDGSYYMEPSRGQFSDKGRGDFAYTYVTKFKPEEGEGILITIGPCCNIDYHQGPEKFIEPDPESLENEEFVVWYAPQLRNDDRVGHEYCWAESVLVNGKFEAKTYPCFAGPMFVPVTE